MAGIDNLSPIKPGEVRNPNGRQKGSKNRATILKNFIALKAKGVDFSHITGEGLPEGMTIEEAMNMKQLEKALGGDTVAWEKINDTIYGKVADKAVMTHSIKKMGTVKVGGEAEAMDVGADVGSDEEDEDDAV